MKKYALSKLFMVFAIVALVCSAESLLAQCANTAGGFGGCFATVRIVDNCGNTYDQVMDLGGGTFCPPITCPPIAQVGVVIGGTFYAAPMSWAPGTGPFPCAGWHDITNLHWDGTTLHVN